ncbi:muscle M-line assembly protein unc-89-like [Schistocerca gregaria]|uniref:muscle M-line assembly protein unc-89-like n=1 Tax=Schistocerca gregaria TaxID=7010 RepID=UPI00211E149B|nr:muscle M-line assembly protein unc-89-like [Schistocerca gregaria]
MARSSLMHCAPLVVALLFVADPVFATGVSEDSDLERSHTSTVRTTVGATAFLMCHLPNIGKEVYWARQQADKVFLKHYRHVTKGFERIEASCSQQDDVCLLTISNVRKTDSGLYFCGVDSTPPIRRFVYLSVSEPETTILGEPFRTHWQGSGINLTCVVQPRRQPGDTVLWMHDDLVIHADHDSRLTITTKMDTSIISQLLLEDAQPKDSGTYTCKLPSGSSDSVEVEVMQVVKDDFHAAMSGGHRPLSAVPPAALVFPVIAAAVGSICR